VQECGQDAAQFHANLAAPLAGMHDNGVDQ
jgi:hypothetical protein